MDDDAVARGLLSSILKDRAETLTATSAKEALELVKVRRPDLILLDDQMPGEMSGIDALERLKKTPETADIPVVMITATRAAGDTVRSLSAGAVDYILKPLDPRQISKRILDRLKRMKLTVLIVDDDKTVRALLEQRFRAKGYRILAAETGSEALAAIRRTVPVLAVLDRVMPDMDGADVLRALRENPFLADVPVVFLTANSVEKDVIEGITLGAADYIVKPFDPKEAVDRCMRVLERYGEGAVSSLPR